MIVDEIEYNFANLIGNEVDSDSNGHFLLFIIFFTTFFVWLFEVVGLQ